LEDLDVEVVRLEDRLARLEDRLEKLILELWKRSGKEDKAEVHHHNYCPDSRPDTFKVDWILTIRAILHVLVEQGKLEEVGEALAKMPEAIDVYKVTGEYDIIATARQMTYRDSGL